MKHRRPNLPHWSKGKGFCRWCGEAVLRPDGAPSARRWHSDCVTAYKIACWPAEARKAVWERDKGICGGCGRDLAMEMYGRLSDEDLRAYEGLRVYDPGVYGYYRYLEGPTRPPQYFIAILPPPRGEHWQADHIVPLIEANRDDLSFWSLSNLRVLCDACHKAETAALARRRAEGRKTSKPVEPTHQQTALL